MNNTTNEGSKLYLYSITSVAILGGLLFGYDTAVISGAEKGLEAFFLSASDFQYNKVMHGITSSSALIGCVLGGALSGVFASRLGRRNSLRLAAVLFFLSALGSYYPEVLFFEYGKPNMDLLIAFNLYRVLGGIGVGLASAVCPMYIAEIAPSNIRGTLVSCNQFAIIFGMLVVYFVNYLIMGDHQNPIILKDAAGVLSVSAESDMWTVQEGWRYMFGSEAFPAAFFGLLLFFVPKTPRYLVLVQQEEKAYTILEKINGKNKAQEILNDIKATAQEKTEKLFTYGVTVIVIGILLSVFQQAIGINAVLYYAPRIFENAGAEGGGMMQTVIMGIVNIIFTLVAIFTVDRFGRKPLLIIGSIGMAVGAFAVAMCDSMAIKGVLPVLSIIVYAAFFMMSWGPICWVLISEIFPNTIRGKAVAIAVAFQWIFNYIVSSTFPALYDFSPMFAYSLYGVGETKVSRGPGRREIGHGALAERALLPVLPSEEEFPYAIRTVSETFESNGSTSMASTCASCMSLMAAGVPIKKMVAGISCGLVTGDTDDDFVLLTDIQGLEDFFGDMDFKVTGTHDGITAIQMDIKIHGLTKPIVEGAIGRCREAREFIMANCMSPAISAPRKEVGPYAPKIISIQIDPDKIGDVVGQRGKTINEIIARTGVKIDINDEGQVSVCGTDHEMMDKAVDMIKMITTDFEEGQIFQGTVVSIKEFGAFIEFAPGKEGMVHISKIAKERINRVEDVLTLGDKVTVVCLGKDKMGRISFSMKDVAQV